jgi:hypothetical protein
MRIMDIPTRIVDLVGEVHIDGVITNCGSRVNIDREGCFK